MSELSAYKEQWDWEGPPENPDPNKLATITFIQQLLWMNRMNSNIPGLCISFSYGHAAQQTAMQAGLLQLPMEVELRTHSQQISAAFGVLLPRNIAIIAKSAVKLVVDDIGMHDHNQTSMLRWLRSW